MSLKQLKVIDRLEVGPVRLEPSGLSASYAVFSGKSVASRDLAYRYEEDVFSPDSAADQNLAAMIAAQVALNYGLFCGEIVFHGPFDGYDRKFISDYAAHTAREIYVKKFLEPNPFLIGPAADLSAEVRASYLQAKLRFEGPDISERPPAAWSAVEGRDCVLSSGGKDSLLSYGLLREMGREVHPVFINESGRHWFTALNAYRHFAREVPETARVWTNADRVFSHMLRQLPFVRSDFARVRSDEYPIRLWTVAVFLFGALPLLRHRRIGRLIVGDEHDTTHRSSHHGITHYNGLYDQSRWFDNAMTRYFHRKEWQVSQFSLLRSLSELLIEKVLVERFPDLQRLQMSCHATHVDGNQIRPCGRCEKCRRIIGMLRAIDADPTRCGYSAEQVEDALARLAEEGVHQEEAGIQQLFHRLRERGLIGETKQARERREVEQLRFDRQRSPFETVPADIRPALHRTLLQHSLGAVQRRGRAWVSCDALSAEALGRPYPYERRASADETRADSAYDEAATTIRLGELTWPEAGRRFKEVDVALLPVGAIEQHGPHLPLDTDAFDALRLAEEVAEGCSNPRPLVLPLLPYGVSYHHDEFPGTLSIGPDTLAATVYEIGVSAARNGITKLVIINGHGGNGPALHFAAQMVNRDVRIFTCVDSGETSDVDVEALAETHNDAHAGEIETSTSLANRPGMVRLDRAESFVPRFSSHYLDFSSHKSVGWYAYTERISKSGVLGDPSKASREKGVQMWAVMVKNLVELVEDLKWLSLDEIHQRRY